MSLPVRLRWTLYAVAAAATAAAMWRVDEPGSIEVVQPVARGGSGGAPRTGAPTRSTAPLALPADRGLGAPLADPFAVAVSAAVAAETSARAAPVAASASVAGAPPLPFSFVGRWKENGKTFVFLQRDDRSYKVERPGPLDSEYAVQSIEENRIALRYLPLGLVQELAFDAPAAPPAAVAQTPPAAPEPTDKSEN